jgi:hypothetical protein
VWYTEQYDTSLVVIEELAHLECPSSLHEIDVNLSGIRAEAVGFGHRLPHQQPPRSYLSTMRTTEGKF